MQKNEKASSALCNADLMPVNNSTNIISESDGFVQNGETFLFTDFQKKILRKQGKLDCAAKEKKECIFSTISQDELYNQLYTPHAYIVEQLLCPGLYILAGAPKVGKSFLALQIGYSVSLGQDLWGLHTKKSKVLYCALEDTFPRLQDRSFAMFKEKPSPNLFLAIATETLLTGLENQLQYFLKQNTNTQLIIIDTLQLIRDSHIMPGASSYSNDYHDLSQLKNFADKNNLCILLIHHTRKQHSEDVHEMILGTNGLPGAADGNMILYMKDRNSNEAYLSYTSRDYPAKTFILDHDQKTLNWNLVDTANTQFIAPADELLEKVNYFLVKKNGNWKGTASLLCSELKLDMTASALSRYLNVNNNRLFNEYNISYSREHKHAGRFIFLKKIKE